jgi:hypothetical protein
MFAGDTRDASRKIVDASKWKAADRHSLLRKLLAALDEVTATYNRRYGWRWLAVHDTTSRLMTRIRESVLQACGAGERPDAWTNLAANIKAVAPLVQAARRGTKDSPSDLERADAVARSAIVLLVACWEAFVEDLATGALRTVLRIARSPSDVETRVRVAASNQLRAAADEREVWKLADDGWRSVLRDYGQNLVGAFHTPNTTRIDDLFKRVVGLNEISASWRWRGMKATGARAALDRLLTLRHEIAHRVQVGTAVTAKDVSKAMNLILRLAEASTREVNRHTTRP